MNCDTKVIFKMEDEKDFDDIPEYRSKAAEEKYNIREELEDIKNFEISIMNFEELTEKVESNVRVLDSESQTRLSEAASKERHAMMLEKDKMLEDLVKRGDPWANVAKDRRDAIEGLIRASASKSLMVDMMRQGILKLRGLLERQRKTFVETERIKAEKSMFETTIESMNTQMKAKDELYAAIIIRHLDNVDRRLAAILASVESGKEIPQSAKDAMQLPEIERIKAEIKLMKETAKSEEEEGEEDSDNASGARA